MTHAPEDPFLEIDVKGGREHIRAYHMGDKAHLSLSFSRCLLTIEERSHMSLRGERHVNVCYICFALIFSYPTFSRYPISDSGGRKSSYLGEENLWNSLHIFNPWGHGYIQMKY